MIENHFLTRMLSIDPNYGSQDHQRVFLLRMDRWQSIEPCTHDHEHDATCYSQVTQTLVAAELQPPTQHALPLPPGQLDAAPFVHSDLDGGLW